MPVSVHSVHSVINDLALDSVFSIPVSVYSVVNDLADNNFNNFREPDNACLKPLFSDFPSVSHNYVSKTRSVRNDHGFYRFCDICDKGEVKTISDTSMYFKYNFENFDDANIIQNATSATNVSIACYESVSEHIEQSNVYNNVYRNTLL